MAGDAADALNGTTVKSWTRLVVNNSRDRLRSETGIISVALRGAKRRSDVSVSVKVQWFAPSSCAWVHISQRWQAEKAAILLNGKTICSRTIEAKFQQPPRARHFHGHVLRQPTSFSVWLGGLPGAITEEKLLPALRQITKIRYTSIDIKKASYNERECPAIIQKLLSFFGQLSSFGVQLTMEAYLSSGGRWFILLMLKMPRRRATIFIRLKASESWAGQRFTFNLSFL